MDGPVYAEPLFFDGSVYAVTENDTVYAISATGGAIQWSQHLGTPANSTIPPYACTISGNTYEPDIQPTIGITGTPVIDPASGTIFVAAMISGSGYRLFALNVNTGQQRWVLPLAPAGFDYTVEEQRGALALANGLVYVPFGGFSEGCGSPSLRGWVIAYAVDGNGTQYDYAVPSTAEGDIWAPAGVSVDGSGFVYVVTGDSTQGNSSLPPDFGDAVIKLSPDLKTVVSYFYPPNWAYLNKNDIDLGSTGAALLPGNLVFSIGKEGVGYLLNGSDLGGVGGQLFSAGVCTSGYPGAWGGTAFAQGIIYVPCGSGLLALAVQSGSQPRFTSLWNETGFFAGPPIVAAGAVWTFNIYNGVLFAFNPTNGALITEISLGSVGFVEHFTTPAAGGGLLLFAANQTIYALNPST